MVDLDARAFAKTTVTIGSYWVGDARLDSRIRRDLFDECDERRVAAHQTQ
jgi:hypothetical protein